MDILNDAKKMSELARKHLDLDNAPIKNIFSILENEGIFVVRMPIGGEGLSGAFFYDKQTNNARILINSDRTIGHQIFTAAHEYGHFLMDKEKEQLIIEKDDGKKTAIEKRADSFAANFLMPEDGVNHFIKKVLKIRSNELSDVEIVKVKYEFGTSWQAVLYRLHNLGYTFDCGIEAKTHHTSVLNSLALQLGYRPEKKFREEKTIMPAQVYQLAFKAYFEKKISLNRLADILRCSYDEAKDRVAEIEALAENGQNI